MRDGVCFVSILLAGLRLAARNAQRVVVGNGRRAIAAALDGDGVALVSMLLARLRLIARNAQRVVVGDRRRAVATAFVAALVVSCGGKPTPATPAGGGTAGARSDDSAAMVPPDTMDEIQRILDRKRQSMSRCLALAVDNKELPRNAKGKVTVELVITPDGRASDVKIARATIESKSLDDCLISRVKETQFPDVPRAFPTSYTYGFEAM
jgi:hypothetical protein